MMAEPKRGENRQCWLIEPYSAVQLEPCLFPEDAEWLQWAQACVGGYVERINPRSFIKGDIVSAFCNEDGRSLRLPPNEMAETFFSTQFVGRVLMYVRT
jgi:hypothetical protein